jgi:hypothetical protein
MSGLFIFARGQVASNAGQVCSGSKYSPGTQWRHAVSPSRSAMTETAGGKLLALHEHAVEAGALADIDGNR